MQKGDRLLQLKNEGQALDAKQISSSLEEVLLGHSKLPKQASFPTSPFFPNLQSNYGQETAKLIRETVVRVLKEGPRTNKV